MSRISTTSKKIPIKPNIYFQVSPADEFDNTLYNSIDEYIIKVIYENFKEFFKSKVIRDITSSNINIKSSKSKSYINDKKTDKLYFINIKLALPTTEENFIKLSNKIFELFKDKIPYTDKMVYKDDNSEFTNIREVLTIDTDKLYNQL
jgi:hypothetical protein